MAIMVVIFVKIGGFGPQSPLRTNTYTYVVPILWNRVYRLSLARTRLGLVSLVLVFLVLFLRLRIALVVRDRQSGC